MKVKKEVFDRLKSCLGPSYKNPQQAEIIDSIVGPELRNAGDFFGTFLYAFHWTEPDDDDVYAVFERMYWETGFEERIDKYYDDGIMSTEERDAFRSHVMNRAAEEIGFTSNILTLRIEYQKQHVVVFTQDAGDPRDSEYSVTLVGVFKTEDEAVKTLYSNGVFV